MRKIYNPKIVYWFPRISAIIFFLYILFITYEDLRKVAYFYPFFVQFLSAATIFMLTIVFWKRARMASIMCLVSSLFFLSLSYNHALYISIFLSSVWLLLTAFLYWVEATLEPPKKLRYRKKSADNRVVLEKKPAFSFRLKHGFYSITRPRVAAEAKVIEK